jgi:ribokinase
MYDVITIGSATVDVFAKTDTEEISIRKDGTENHFLAYSVGSKILIQDLDFQVGGGGTNTAVSFSRLGLKTAYLGKIGKDASADSILNLLSKEHIDFIGVRSSGQTGYSVILDSIEEDRTILTYKGVNDELDFSEIKKSGLKTKWFYFSSMMGKSYQTLEKLARYAKVHKIRVAFNPSIYLAKTGLPRLKRLIRMTDFLVLNKEEAEEILGKKDIGRLLHEFKKLGPHIVAITDGKNGVYVCDGNHCHHQPANKVRIKETTGAGDAFSSAFVAGLIIKNNDLHFALNLGMANATSVIKHIGAKNKLLTLKEAMVEMKKNKRVRPI